MGNRAIIRFPDRQISEETGRPMGVEVYLHWDAAPFETQACSMGGGWVFANTEEAAETLTDFFGEEAAPLAPFGGREGWIVEPYMAEDLFALIGGEA
jgi:hypothetical protein